MTPVEPPPGAAALEETWELEGAGGAPQPAASAATADGDEVVSMTATVGFKWHTSEREVKSCERLEWPLTAWSGEKSGARGTTSDLARTQGNSSNGCGGGVTATTAVSAAATAAAAAIAPATACDEED